MALYCLDSNILIQASRQHYAFDIAPVFWNFLDSKFQSKEIICPWDVYDEIKNQKDELARWMRERKDKNYFIKPTEIIQSYYRNIINTVERN